MNDSSNLQRVERTLTLAVRDYECDLQGIVNNSVYFNYYEHARHDYLQHFGINFAELAANGIHLVVVRSELEYKASLVPNDRFQIITSMQRMSKIKIIFKQRIERLDECLDECLDDHQQTTLMNRCIVTGVAKRHHKLVSIDEVLPFI